MELAHEALAGAVDQRCALAADRFARKRGRIATDVDCGRMELHELGIGDAGAGARRDGETVARGLRRIGGHGVEMADAAGGEHDGGGRELDSMTVVKAERAHAGDAAVLEEQILGLMAFDEPNAWRRPHRLGQRRHDGAAGAVAAHMHDAARAMRRLAPDRETAGKVAVERHAVAQEISDALWRLARHGEGGRLVDQAGAGRDGVARMRVRRVALGHRGRDAALRPGARGALADGCRGEHGDGVWRELQRAEEPGNAAADDENLALLHHG